MITHDNIDTFLAELQKEAEHQAKLHQTRVLPAQLDWLTSLVGRYPWQTLIVLSFFTALSVNIVKML